jgi:CRP-like cAMP-binding protein
MNLSADDKKCETCEFKENLAVLRGIGFFAGLPLEPLKVLAYLSTRQTYRPGELLFGQADDDGQSFYILAGEVEMLGPPAERIAAEALRRYGPGGFIGGLALLGQMPRLFALRAVGHVSCLVLSRTKFEKVLERFPTIAPLILRNLVEQIRSWELGLINEAATAGQPCRRNLGVSLL